MKSLLTILIFLLSCARLFPQTQPSVTITWDWDTTLEGPDAHAAGFIVKRTLTGTGIEDNYVDVCVNVTNQECTDSTITNSAAYKYIVAAYEREMLPLYKFGEFSEPFAFTFASIQPNTPGGIISTSATSTTPGRVAVKISWGAVTAFRNTQPIAPQIPSYKLFQASTNSSPGTVITTVSGLSFVVQGLKKNSTYYFYLTCVVGGIESFGSTAIKVQT